MNICPAGPGKNNRLCSRKTFSCLALAILFWAAFVLSAFAGSGDREAEIHAGLGAGEPYTEGPHRDLKCTHCHREEDGEPGTGVSVTGDSVSLCRECHPEEHLHTLKSPPGFHAAAKGDSVLPLGKGIMQGLIVCHTCHAIHRQEYLPHLLRGEGETYAGVRNALCLSCHNDHFLSIAPHTAEASRCGFCHVVKPQENETLRPEPDSLLQASCRLCHPDLTPEHYAGLDPFIDRAVWEMAEKDGSFFAEGVVVCTSCHDPHAAVPRIYRLRGDYLALCEESRSLNPHWNDYLCLSCHQEKPVRGNAPLRMGGDRNLVCNRCHHSEYARPDIHPVDVKPSQHIRIPEDMPLQDGKISCETCHDSLLQMGSRRKGILLRKNPDFLRKTQMSRNSYCFLCHLEETYKRLNPHNQLDAEGKVDQETCLFCHASIPDVNFIGPEKVSFIIHNPDEYCVGCHHGFTLNHPAGVNHLVKPSEKIMAAIRTSVQRIGVELPLFEGRVVCATCHNPHQEGVIKIQPAATGAARQNKLRLMPGRRQCTGCHWDK
jgi:hypothetical protein